MIPKGYEDFVSSHEELLKQFEDLGQSEREDVVFTIYQLDQPTRSPLQAIQSLSSLRRAILDFLQSEIDSYIWNAGNFNLQVVLASSNVPCLKGLVVFGNNIEDEWYTVFLLQRLSEKMPNLAISIRDADGEFLLVEAAEHIESWLSPENAENRVWVSRGGVCFIPLDAPGKLPSGGIKLAHALAYLSNNAAKRFSASAMKVINSRTVSAYPAKALAHEHNAACLLPTWAKLLLSTHPQLIGSAVRAFSATEHSQMSKSISAVRSPAESNLDSTKIQLVATTVKLTRTMYAELTFKKFNVPRRFHYWLRQVQGQSAKLTQAFDLGCRIVCGLLLAYHDQASRKSDWEDTSQRNRQAVERYLQQKGQGLGGLDSESDDVVFEDFRDTLASYVALRQLGVYDAFHSLASQISALCDGVEQQDGAVQTKTELGKILTGQVQGDGDSWMYLDPDQLDKEMKERMAQFGMGDEAAHGLRSEGAESKEGETGAAGEAQGPQEEGAGAAEDLQDAVNRFKSFLSEESDYRGIQPSNPHYSKDVGASSSALAQEDLDMQYIDNLVDLTLAEVAAGAQKPKDTYVDSDDEEEAAECKVEDASEGDDDGDDSEGEDSEENSSGDNEEHNGEEEYDDIDGDEGEDEEDDDDEDLDNYEVSV